MHCSCVFSASGLVQNAKCKRWNKTHLKTFEREPAQFPRYSYADLFKWQKRGFSLFFFFFPFFFWFIGIEKKSSYGRWVFLVYLLKFLHFCAYVPNPQNESGKMLSEWTEWGSSFTSELSRLNNEGLRQPWYTASTSEVAALTREPEIRSLTIQMQCVAAVRGIRSLCNLPLLINLFLSILPHLHTTPHSESVGLSQQCCNEIVWSRALAKTLESIQEGELGS